MEGNTNFDSSVNLQPSSHVDINTASGSEIDLEVGAREKISDLVFDDCQTLQECDFQQNYIAGDNVQTLQQDNTGKNLVDHAFLTSSQDEIKINDLTEVQDDVDDERYSVTGFIQASENAVQESNKLENKTGSSDKGSKENDPVGGVLQTAQKEVTQKNNSAKTNIATSPKVDHKNSSVRVHLLTSQSDKESNSVTDHLASSNDDIIWSDSVAGDLQNLSLGCIHRLTEKHLSVCPNMDAIKDVANSIISSLPQKDRKNFICLLDSFVTLLHNTDNQFMDSDNTTFYLSQVKEHHYRGVLEFILDKYSPEWVDGSIENHITRVFVVNESSSFLFHESLSVLTKSLREFEGPTQKLDFVVNMIEKLVKSKAVVYSVVDQCKKVNSIKCNIFVQNQLSQIWLETVQMIVSLPSRVINKVKHNTVNMTFFPEMYCKILCCHLANCIHCLSCEKEIPCTLEPLSLLLSKIVINFCSGIHSNGIHSLIKLLECWCKNPKYSAIVQKILFKFQLGAIELICKIIFQDCSTPLSVKNLIGDIVTKSNNWKHILCKKMLLMSYQDWENTTLLENLIGYLAYTLYDNLHENRTEKKSQIGDMHPARSLLFDVLISILTVWSDGSALNHTPLEQHIYISQAIILCISYIKNFTGTNDIDSNKGNFECRKLTESDKKAIAKIIFSGVPVHLSCPVDSVRAIGMVTAEIASNILHPSVDNDEGELRLKFDYEKMSTDAKKIVSALSELASKTYKVDDKPVNNISRSELEGNKILSKLEQECNVINSPDEENIKEYKNVDNIQKHLKEKTVETGKNFKSEQQFPESPLDSDDDEEDDGIPPEVLKLIKNQNKKRPRYLRDLLSGLMETEDVERFTESFDVLEELITSQLPDDDVSLALELLELLICLEERFCIDDFDSKRFSASIAIIIIFPAQCAEYLCKEFNTGFGKYSISHLLYILDSLAGAAKQLSSIPCKEENKLSQSKKNTSKSRTLKRVENIPLTAQEMVQKRIESHTKRFISPPVLPTYHKNEFSAIVGSFFFPLIHGFYQRYGGDCLWEKPNMEREYLLLVHFLHTLAVIMVSATNSPVAVRMGKELLELTWSFRYHSEAKVRLAVMSCIGAVITCISPTLIIPDLQEPVLECRLWLIERTTDGMTSREPNSDCREFAAFILSIIEKNIIPQMRIIHHFAGDEYM